MVVHFRAANDRRADSSALPSVGAPRAAALGDPAREGRGKRKGRWKIEGKREENRAFYFYLFPSISSLLLRAAEAVETPGAVGCLTGDAAHHIGEGVRRRGVR